jgi:hypothetical protein
MASEIQICNLALSHLGGGRIQSINDNAKEAIECKILYPMVLESTLRSHKWAFATKRLLLGLLDEEVPGFRFVYRYPGDCLVAREIYSVNQFDKVKFEIALGKDNQSRVILSDQESAVLIYTAKVENANIFDSIFIEALSWKLAGELAISLKGNTDLMQLSIQNFEHILSKAQTASANEGFIKPEDDNPYFNARL